MRRFALLGVVVAVAAAIGAPTAASVPVPGTNVLYTLDADFDKGTLVNVNHNAPNNNQLQLNATTSTFPFIWIALSNRGTIAKIDTATGAILGEFSTGPDPYRYPDPSRTTVTFDGSVWAGNRQHDCRTIGEQQSLCNLGSVIHVGLEEANQCVDRNGNGTIETSSGYGDVLLWPDPLNADADGGVSTALDECILHYTKVQASCTRHVSVDPSGDIWVSGQFCANDSVFQKIDGDTGAIVRTDGPFDCGGYGGLVDGNGVVWSASSSGDVLRWNPNAPLVADENPECIDISNYGMAIDSGGNIWISTLDGSGTVRKVSPDGNTIQTFSQGTTYAQGLAVDGNDHVWISSSLVCSSNCTVAHLKNDGSLVGLVPVGPGSSNGGGPTGIAVDSSGKVWSANINSSDASRIDPNGGPLGPDGVTRVGALDLTVELPAGPALDQPIASPYNYSDMTGAALLTSTAPQGTWTVVQDGGAAGAAWGTIVWNSEPQGSTPAGTSITVEARAANSEAGLGGLAFVNVTNGAPFTLTGRFLHVRVTLRPSAAGTSPVLSDIRICAAGVTCAGAAPPPGATAAPGSCRVTARPRSVPAGESSLFRIRVTRGEQAVTNRRVAFRGPGIATSRKTNASGRLSIRLTPGKRGIVKVSVPGLGRGCRARVSVFGTVGGAQLTGRE